MLTARRKTTQVLLAAVVVLSLGFAGCARDDGYDTCYLETCLLEGEANAMHAGSDGDDGSSAQVTPTPAPTVELDVDVDLDELLADPAFAAHFASGMASCLVDMPGQDAYCECSLVAMWTDSLELSRTCLDLIDMSGFEGYPFDDLDALLDYMMDNMDPDVLAAWEAQILDPETDAFWEGFFAELEDGCTLDHGWDYCDCRMMMLVMRYRPEQVRVMTDHQLAAALEAVSPTCINFVD